MTCLLIDNDILHKLASTDLLDDAITSLGLATRDCYILPTAKYQFGVVPKGRSRALRKYGELCVSVLERSVPEMSEIDWDPDAATIDALHDVPDVDPQDAVLAASCIARNESKLSTGDKRFLIALANHSGLGREVQLLKGRVICMEQILAKITNSQGVDYLYDHVDGREGCDMVIQIVFGKDRVDRSREAILDSLASYEGDLRDKTCGLV